MPQTRLSRDYKKVLKVIESCTTREHLKGAHNMVRNFKSLYKAVGYPKLLSYILDRKIKEKL